MACALVAQAETGAGGFACTTADALPVREHRQFHAGREVLAGRGNDDRAGRGFIVDLVHDLWEFVPECAVHRVERVGALQLNVRDLVLGLDVEAGVGGHEL